MSLKRNLIFLAVTLTLVVCGMTVPGQKRKAQNKQAKTLDIVFPLPPETPRIRYINSISNNLDIEPPKKKGWLKKLINETESTQIVGMTRPSSVAVDSTERIFVADPLNAAVFVFDLKAKKMDLLGTSGRGRLSSPFGVAVDKNDNVYVSDTAQKRVNVYNRTGDLIASVVKVGSETLTNPTGLAVDNERNRLLIVDSRAHRIFAVDLGQLDRGTAFGKPGDGDDQFYFPSFVTVDNAGNIYVADTLNFCVKIFDKDFRFIRRFGEHGTGLGMFDRPKGIAVDSEGHIYVVDSAFSNFQIFESDGQLLLFVGGFGSDHGFFRLPAGLFIDKRDRIYVADSINRRIQIFQYLPKK